MDERLKRYVAFAVDDAGVARATYEFSCRTDAEARSRAEKYLTVHDIIELWLDHRRIVRLRRGSEIL
jgi:hypothetical protein